MAITVLIADDHPLFRKGLRQVLETDTEIRVVAEANNGEEAEQLILQTRPNVAVLDIDMPKKDGFQVVRALRVSDVQAEIVFLTMYKEEHMFDEAIDLGVKGYVLKESTSSDIVACVKTVASGKHYISPVISEYLIGRSEKVKAFVKKFPALHQLTNTERRILRLIAENKTSPQIAEALHVSVKTVENHRTNIADKLNLHGAHALLKFALENKTSL